MSYDHKDLVQSGTRKILSEKFVQVDSSTWRRKTDEELALEVEAFEASLRPIVKPPGFLRKLIQNIKGKL